MENSEMCIFAFTNMRPLMRLNANESFRKTSLGLGGIVVYR